MTMHLIVGQVCIVVPLCRDTALGLLLRLQDRLLTPWVGMSFRLIPHKSSHWLNIGDGLMQSSSLVFVLNTRVKQMWAWLRGESKCASSI
jgi:hypothetical protein